MKLISGAAVQPATPAGALRALDRLWRVPQAVQDAIRTQAERAEALDDEMRAFIFVIPKVGSCCMSAALVPLLDAVWAQVLCAHKIIVILSTSNGWLIPELSAGAFSCCCWPHDMAMQARKCSLPSTHARPSPGGA